MDMSLGKVLEMVRGREAWHAADSDDKEAVCNAGDLGSIPGLGRSPGGGHGNPLQYSCLENPYEQRRLAGYSPWGRKESDTTERLSTKVPTVHFAQNTGILLTLECLVLLSREVWITL